jgi:hypothetical protein
VPQTATFFAKAASDVPCALLGKLNAPLQLRAEMQQPVEVPKYARFLRGAFAPGTELGVVEQSEPKKRRRVEGNDGDGLDVYMYLFHVCFTGLHFVSWETILALRLTFAFLFGGTCLKKTSTTQQWVLHALVCNSCLLPYSFMQDTYSFMHFALINPGHLSRPRVGQC